MNSKFIKISHLFLICCFFNYSCTYKYVKSESQEIEKYYSKINILAKHYTAEIYFMDGSSSIARNLTINSDLTSWTKFYNETVIKIPTNRIHKIEFTNHFKGMMGGILFGFLGGLITSLLLISDEGNSEGGGGYAILGITTIGTLGGAIVGGFKGDQQVFIINSIQVK